MPRISAYRIEECKDGKRKLQSFSLHNAKMEKHERLKWARERRFGSAAEAARVLNIPYGTYSGHENGSRGIKDDEERRYASAFRVPLAWLALGEGDPSEPLTTPIVGYVGAGGEAHFYGLGQGPFGEVERPPDGTSQTVAVIVSGTSMSGVADDQSILYYEDVRTPPTLDLSGRLCIIGLNDGMVLVKKLYISGTPSRYDLYSTNEPPMFDQGVEWAARVTWIRPR